MGASPTVTWSDMDPGCFSLEGADNMCILRKTLSSVLAGVLALSIFPCMAFGVSTGSLEPSDPATANLGQEAADNPGKSDNVSEQDDPSNVDDPAISADGSEENVIVDDADADLVLGEGGAPDVIGTPDALETFDEAASPDDVVSFVSRLYDIVLGRSPDLGGLGAFADALKSGHSAAEVVWGFFGSQEFSSKGFSSADCVEKAYRAMLGRPADSSGKAAWIDALDSGMSIRYVVAGFTGSYEFKSLCSKWGINPGFLYVVEPRDRSYSVTAFVQRLYQKVLDRPGDAGGLNTFTNTLLAGHGASDVVWAFFGSPEFLGKGLSSGDIVDKVYLAMLNRGADPGGRAAWADVINMGMTVRCVVVGFVGSPEFKALCAKWGLNPGALHVTEPRDRNQGFTRFVQRFYTNALGRGGDSVGLNMYTGYLLNGGNATDLALQFFSSPEFIARNLGNDARIDAVYGAMLDRVPDPTGKADWLASLNGGMSMQSFVSGLASSSEFLKLCQNYGIAPHRYWDMDNRVNGLSSQTNWLIAVDTNRFFVTVYHGGIGNWHVANRFDCAPGKPSTPSRKGIYTVGIKGYVFGHGYSCYYYTQYSGDYLFHSIKYNPGTFVVQDGTMGAPASEGCIRLWIENAKYIYDTVPYGSTVLVY